MTKIMMNKKGVVLIIVLTTVLIAAILANVILGFILSHYRFTHHQSSRIQAYYASLAGMNLAQEKLRIGAWTTTPAGQPYTLCSSGCTVNDPDMRYKVTITISAPVNGLRTLGLKTTYTYTLN